MAKNNKNKKKQSSGGQQFLSDESYIRQRTRELEIGPCYITDGIVRNGEGYVIVSRKHTGGRLSLACYLVDAWCCGVKDSFYRLRQENFEFEEFVEKVEAKPCSYDEAHNWVYGAIDYAEEAGIKPDKSFALTKYFLEEDTDDIPLIEYEFGKDGKHCLVTHSRLETSQYLPLLKKNLGEGNYSYILPAGADPLDDDDDEEEKSHAYSPEGLPTIDQLTADWEKDLLLELGNNLYLDLDPDDSVEVLRQKYREQVIDNIENILLMLPNEDMLFLASNAKAADPTEGVPESRILHNNILEVYGFATVVSHEDEERPRIYIATDFAAAANPHLMDVMAKNTYASIRTVDNYIEGLANLYGMVSLETVKERLYTFLKCDKHEDVDIQETVDKVYAHSLAMREMIYTLKDEQDDNLPLDKTIFFVSRFAFYRHSDLYEKLQATEIEQIKLYPFADSEIMDAGVSFIPLIPNSQRERFTKYITKKLKCDVAFAEEMICRMWFYANHEGIPSLSELSQERYFLLFINSHLKKLLSEQEEQEAFGHLYRLMDNMPRWTLRGGCKKG